MYFLTPDLLISNNNKIKNNCNFVGMILVKSALLSSTFDREQQVCQCLVRLLANTIDFNGNLFICHGKKT